MFRLRDIEKRYGEVVVLRIPDACIPSDQFTFILGPSGSGKSTLVRLLSFVEIPEEGTVSLELGDQRFSSTSKARPWPVVTCVFQRLFLWPHLTLRQNITLPLRMRGSRGVRERVTAMIELFEMSRFVDRYPNQVSGGEAQRAALARALALEPQLIIIDEAHGGLDIEQQHILNGHLVKLRALGTGLVVVTHSLAFAQRYADWVVVLENGQIAETGGPNVFANPASSFLRRIQIEDTRDSIQEYKRESASRERRNQCQ